VPVADSERGAMGALGRGVESAQNQPMVGFVSGRACGSGCKRCKEDAIRRRRSRVNKIQFEENGKDWIGYSKRRIDSARRTCRIRGHLA
jgi:hypothetical protein